MNLDEFCQQHGLPESYRESARRSFLPFADWLEDRMAKHGDRTYVLGLNGAQGTGKSTLAQLIHDYLTVNDSSNVVILSIDDIYLTRQERQTLADQVHPLLRTRGVPGTHDVALGMSVIEQLTSLQPGATLQVPRFDKSRDDRFPQCDWNTVTGPVDLLIFEGWCVASKPVSVAELEVPVNALESCEDADGRWRTYVNERLCNDYAKLFALLDSLLFLKAPDFDAVLRWRLEQEHKLRDNTGENANAIMSDEQVATFIQHYERITRNNLAVLPALADAVIELDVDHRATSLRCR